MSSAIANIKKVILFSVPAIFLVIGSLVTVYLALWTHPNTTTDLEQIPTGILSGLPSSLDLRPFYLNTKPPVYAQIRDPFVIPELTKEPEIEELPQLKLTMIIINKRHKMCRVNGKLYLEGEKGPDFQIKYIGEHKVLIERRGRGQWLFLTQNS